MIEISAEELLSYIPIDVINADGNLMNDLIRDAELVNINIHESNDAIESDREEDDNISVLSDAESEAGNVENKSMLSDILRSLIKLGHKVMWKEITPHQLFHEYLHSANSIAHFFIVKELDIINDIVKLYTGQYIFKKSNCKEVKVNKLCAKFGDKSTWSSGHKRLKYVKSLKSMCLQLTKKDVLKKVIRVVAAGIKYQFDYEEWCQNKTIPLDVPTHHRKETFNLFCYPEYSEKRQQLEPRTIEPTHMFTNLRAHVCHKGFDNVSRNAFIRVTESNPELLKRTLVTEIVDQ